MTLDAAIKAAPAGHAVSCGRAVSGGSTTHPGTSVSAPTSFRPIAASAPLVGSRSADRRPMKAPSEEQTPVRSASSMGHIRVRNQKLRTATKGS